VLLAVLCKVGGNGCVKSEVDDTWYIDETELNEACNKKF
jgi:hypothetical protein